MFPALKLPRMFYHLNTIVEQLLLSDVMAAGLASRAAVICPLHSSAGTNNVLQNFC